MEENKMILHLMQNVSDKLDGIKEHRFSEEQHEKIVSYQKGIAMSFDKIIENQSVINSQVIKMQELIVASSNDPNVVHQKKEYYVFGKDTPFASRFLLITILVVFIASFGVKYIPSYLVEKSELKTERDEYKLFYEFVFLNQYDEIKRRPEYVVDALDKIKKKDTLFMRHLNTLNKQYSAQLKKEDLLRQLEKLENRK